MKFIKLLKYDIHNGFRQNMMKIISVFIISIILCADFYFAKQRSYALDGEVPVATFLDYACYLFGGMAEYVPSLGEGFKFPVRWFLLHLLLFYATLHYPIRDLFSLGISVLPRSEKRSFWWHSKCLWIMVYTIFSYLLIYIAIFLFCSLIGEEVSFMITPEFLNRIMGARTTFDKFNDNLVYAILLLPMMITVALNLIQMLLSLVLKPLLSYLLIITFCLAGTYFNSSLIWSNFAMPLRSEFIVLDGYSVGLGVMLCMIIILITIIIGGAIFHRMNILDKDENY